MESQASWIADLNDCPFGGMGLISPARYIKGEAPQPEREAMDVAFYKEKCGVRLYGQFTALNGSCRVAKYVADNLVFEIFCDDPFRASQTDDEIIDKLFTKFENVERGYCRNQIQEKLTRRMLLQEESAGNDAAKAELDQINRELNAGATALIAFIIEKRLFIMNCGTSRALLISMESNEYKCEPLNAPHNTDNADERERIRKLGLDPESVPNPTRAIGDAFRRKEFSDNPKAPLLAEPDIYKYDIDPSCRYLLLVSDGVVQTVEEMSKEDVDVNSYIMDCVLKDIKQDPSSSYTMFAQGSIELIGRQHLDKFMKNELRDSKRLGMSIVLVDLNDPQTFESSEYNSVDSILETQLSDRSLGEGTIEPYVDLVDFKNHPNREKILAELTSIGITYASSDSQ